MAYAGHRPSPPTTVTPTSPAPSTAPVDRLRILSGLDGTPERHGWMMIGRRISIGTDGTANSAFVRQRRPKLIRSTGNSIDSYNELVLSSRAIEILAQKPNRRPGLPGPSETHVHHGAMTELLEQAIERIRALPPGTQDDVARVLLSLADGEGAPVILSQEERAAIAVSKAAAERGEFATDAEVRAI